MLLHSIQSMEWEENQRWWTMETWVDTICMVALPVHITKRGLYDYKIAQIVQKIPLLQ